MSGIEKFTKSRHSNLFLALSLCFIVGVGALTYRACGGGSNTGVTTRVFDEQEYLERIPVVKGKSPGRGQSSSSVLPDEVPLLRTLKSLSLVRIGMELSCSLTWFAKGWFERQGI